MTKQEFIDWIGVNPDQKGLAMVTLEGVIAEAIAEHEAKQWHYDHNFPSQKEILVETEYGFFIVETETSYLDAVIRWRELPAPYQEGGHND